MKIAELNTLKSAGADIKLPRGVKFAAVEMPDKGTGLSVFVFEKGLKTAAVVLGGAPGSREIEITNAPDKKLNAVVFAGGSAMGLSAAGGVAQYLKELGLGHKTGFANVPLVASAVVYDLFYKGFHFPSEADGFAVCQNLKDTLGDEGDTGAGFATMCNKVGGGGLLKSGAGFAKISSGDIKGFVYCINNAVGAFALEKVAGYLNKNGFSVKPPEKIQRSGGLIDDWRDGNTVLTLVVLNIKAGKDELKAIGREAAEAIPALISPAFTEHDGDIIFVATTDERERSYELSEIGAACRAALEEALIRTLLFCKSNEIATAATELLKPQ